MDVTEEFNRITERMELIRKEDLKKVKEKYNKKAHEYKRVYRVEENSCPFTAPSNCTEPHNYGRTAEISFVTDIDGGWEFNSCKYKLESASSYNYEDWLFLKNVANEIIRITELLCEGEYG